MSGAALYVKEDLQITSTQEEILVGCLNVCSLIGSLAAGKTSDQIGRRYTILLAAATFFLGAILMGLAPSFPYLIAGRVVAGIGVGFSLMIAPVYSSELSPASTRGFLSSLPEVFINVGILLGYISNYFLAGSGLPSSLNWRVMLGLAAFPALLVGFAVVFMPESPHWLVMKGRFAEAKRVLIRTSSSEEEVELVDSRMNEMVKAISMAELPPSSGFWTELVSVRSKAIRRIVITAVGVNFFMQASGNDAVVYYSPEVFKVAGISSRKQLFGVTVIMGIAKSSFALVSALFLDRFGRRPLLLLGSSGMAVSLALLGLGSKYLDQAIMGRTM
ncbi:unnamed protein product [Linum tenue]|uniref:Major facilitator superfamily (MFS) profile domain-containing protein n=1 Tax=Linum tenue TaxID=586396 RepID=A0AAV0HXD7_9ROSI|nr:unnamed protein product [Linum tenue]